jgi:hypothetical protein
MVEDPILFNWQEHESGPSQPPRRAGVLDAGPPTAERRPSGT